MRSCWNKGLIRPFTSRSDNAQSSSVASTEPPVIAAIHDRRIMVAQRVRKPLRSQL
jgi:hypothetical protein